MTTTRTRSRGHTGSRASAARAGAERKPVIIASALGGAMLLAFAALVTSIGHIVLAATDHFMLKYSGVFALVLLTTSAVMGVLATDRIILNPGHRVIAQAVHRAVAFATLAFLVVHIVLEITAPHLEESKTLHVHLLDAFIPFLSQYRTFYMAEGTIASDLIILLVVTGILRRRFSTNGNAWKWRAIHYSNYAALILGILHGLLAGRQAIGTFVYWSYGVVLAMLAIAVLVRIIATSLRTREMVAGAAPLADNRGSSSAQSMPVRAAALGLMSQMSGAMPLGGATRAVPALQGGPAMPFPSPYAPVAEPARAIAALPEPGRPGGGYGTGPQPAYAAGSRRSHRTGPQPAYEGESRPPRGTGPQPAYRPGTGPQAAYPLAPPEQEFPAAHRTGPQPGYRTGPQPVYDSGPQPVYDSGPRPVYDSGPPAARERDYGAARDQDYPYGPDPRYGPGYAQGPGYGPDSGYGRDRGYDAEPRYEPDDYGPEPGYGTPPRRPQDAYGGPPPGYPAGQPQPGPRRRPLPPDRNSGERTGPLPRVPSYGGDERR